MAMMVPPQMNPKYKTSLCKHWTTTGNCSIGSRCHFAHGERELRNPNDVKKLYIYIIFIAITIITKLKFIRSKIIISIFFRQFGYT